MVYRLQLLHQRRWRWGLNDYTLEQAERRIKELKAVGIKARVKPIDELFA